MPALDFTEIPPAHEGTARDQFELFARDALAALGFEILRDPDRGPDAGRDIIARDNRLGAGGTTVVDFLVSCKHKAHSGKAVAHDDDQNIRDRIGTHKCNGFIAFYSTVPSSTLGTHLDGLSSSFEVIKFDAEKIETRLLSSPEGRAVAARYFPKSYQKWVVSSQYAQQATSPQPLSISDKFFLRAPHDNLDAAKTEAKARGVPVFAVIFDPDHSSRSDINYCLGNFMRWETTKRMVDESFVAVVGPSSDPAFFDLVPDDDPLEECRLVIFTDQVTHLSESVYANASEGRKRVMAVLASCKRLSPNSDANP